MDSFSNLKYFITISINSKHYVLGVDYTQKFGFNHEKNQPSQKIDLPTY